MSDKHHQHIIEHEIKKPTPLDYINTLAPHEVLNLYEMAVGTHDRTSIKIILQDYKHIKRVNLNKHLITAIRRGDQEMTLLLIPIRKDLDTVMVKDTTPLITAIGARCTPIINELRLNGASIDTPNNRGITPLHIAVKLNFPEIVSTLLHLKAKTNVEDNMGRTPLEFAIGLNNIHMTHMLLLCGALPNHRNQDDENSVFLAISKQTELLKLLLEFGSDPNLCNAFAETPLSRLIISEESDKEEKARLLLHHKGSSNITTSDGDTLLHMALYHEEVSIAKLLIQYGAEVNKKNVYAATPLTLAGSRGTPEIIELLIQKGADITAKDRFEHTALHNALYTRAIPNIKKLLKLGAPIFFDQNTPRIIHQDNLFYPSGCLIAKQAAWLNVTGKAVQIDQIYELDEIMAWLVRKYEDCMSELKRMEDTVCFNQVTVLDVLTMPILKLVEKMQNTENQERLKEIIKDFNIFKEELVNKITEGQQRFLEWKRTENFLENTFEDKIPRDLHRKIAMYVIQDEPIKFKTKEVEKNRNSET